MLYWYNFLPKHMQHAAQNLPYWLVTKSEAFIDQRSLR